MHRKKNSNERWSQMRYGVTGRAYLATDYELLLIWLTVYNSLQRFLADTASLTTWYLLDCR